MRALLVRVGADTSKKGGGWNAPIEFTSHEFVYCPIPEKEGRQFRDGMALNYRDVQRAIDRLRSKTPRNAQADMMFPSHLASRWMHLDPDFEYLTYGDNGENPRGERLRRLTKGDLLVFYGGLKPAHRCDQKLIYALIGLFTVSEVVRAADIVSGQFQENAHTRRLGSRTSDVIVRGQPGKSGRFERCIPIGEWRNRAYRVTPSIEEAWGGLEVKDGYIQRSGVPPFFCNAARFQRWLFDQGVNFMQRNN